MRDKIFGCIRENNSFIIAYSGGLDSHVLLHVMSVLRAQNPLVQIQAVHVNHQLNPLSNAWSLHCKKICNALTIPIYIERTIH